MVSLFAFQVWFKNRRAKYRKEVKRGLLEKNVDNQEARVTGSRMPKASETNASPYNIRENTAEIAALTPFPWIPHSSSQIVLGRDMWWPLPRVVKTRCSLPKELWRHRQFQSF